MNSEDITITEILGDIEEFGLSFDRDAREFSYNGKEQETEVSRDVTIDLECTPNEGSPLIESYTIQFVFKPVEA